MSSTSSSDPSHDSTARDIVERALNATFPHAAKQFQHRTIPKPHVELTSTRHHWIKQWEENQEWCELEPRPWSNTLNRAHAGCVGDDYILHDPRIHMRYFWNPTTEILAGAIHFDGRAEGPPKCAHGASIASVCDEILAFPQWLVLVGGYTATLTVNYLHPIPLRSTVRFESRITSRDGRKVTSQGTITSGDEKIIHVKCEGLFITPASKDMNALGEKALKAKL